MFTIHGYLLGLILLSVFPVCGQTANPDSTEPTTIRTNVRRALLDVVVTNSAGEPVTALSKEQFRVFENGQPQSLTSFEEHAGLPDISALQAKLPPNTFSNLPLAKAGDAANVLLLDALNTQMSDQSYVHTQMVKYIKGIRPGTRLAIFALGERLRFIQGFTGDPALLMAAVNGQKSAGNPQLSPLLQTSAETDADNTITAQMQDIASATGSTQIQAAAAAFQQFLAEQVDSKIDVRVHTTLEAMQQLSLYLQGIPGRKNVIWFSGSFPLTILGGNDIRQYQDEVTRTSTLLTAAQIAIYPIGAQGLAVDSLYDFSGPRSPKSSTGQQMTQYQVNTLQNGSTDRAAAFAAMDELAKDTGGEAFYNTNGLNEVLDDVLKHGTHYYTITYAPTNKNMDGRLRHIEVKVGGGNYRLSYRRGYYANDMALTQTAPAKPTGDPLRPLMEHGTPDSTAIVYTMRVEPANPQPAPGAARTGDNENLKGPVTRYAVNFNVPADHLTLEPAPDGVRHGSIEATLLGYDRDGKPLNWMVRMFQLTLPPDRYAVAQASGLSFNLEIDVPAADVYLRSGVYDQGSNKAGTLEIPLAALVALAAAPKADKPMPAEIPLTVYGREFPLPETPVVPATVPQRVMANYASCPLSILRHDVRQLAHLKPAKDQSQLPALLSNIGDKTVKIARKTPNLISHEYVVSKGEIREMRRNYSFLILQHPLGSSLVFDEYRVDIASGAKIATDFGKTVLADAHTPPSLSDMSTQCCLPKAPAPQPETPLSQGFISQWLFFYPLNQPESDFRYLGEQEIDGHHTLVVAFAQKAGSVRLPATYTSGKTKFPLLMQGVAWVDSSDFRIVRLRTDLLSAPTETALGRLTSDIQFKEIHLADLPSALWLPSEVEITAKIGEEGLHESHTYSDYRLFRAQSRIVLN